MNPIQQIEYDVLSALAIFLGILANAAGYYVVRKLNLQLSEAQKDRFEGDAKSAIAYGISIMKQDIEQKGWAHPEVQASVVATSAPYMINKFPDSIKAMGLKLNDPDIQAQVRGVLTRVFSDVVATQAASPATPPVTAPMIPTINIPAVTK